MPIRQESPRGRSVPMEKRKTKKAVPRAAAAATASATQAVSRYRRFQKILDQAAGKSESDYGGLGARVWNTPKLDDLLNASLEGVRLIAPHEEAGHSRFRFEQARPVGANPRVPPGLSQG